MIAQFRRQRQPVKAFGGFYPQIDRAQGSAGCFGTRHARKGGGPGREQPLRYFKVPRDFAGQNPALRLQDRSETFPTGRHRPKNVFSKYLDIIHAGFCRRKDRELRRCRFLGSFTSTNQQAFLLNGPCLHMTACDDNEQGGIQ